MKKNQIFQIQESRRNLMEFYKNRKFFFLLFLKLQNNFEILIYYNTIVRVSFYSIRIVIVCLIFESKFFEYQK